MKNFVKAIVCTLVIGLTIFYLFLPPINITSLEFYSFLIFLILVYLCFRYVIFDIRNIGNGIRGLVKYGVFIVILIILPFVVNLFLSPLFNAKGYSNRIVVKEDGDFKNDVAEVDFNHIPLLDKDSSQKLGDRVMGQLPELVSQFYVSDLYTQINYNNKIVRVTPLEYNGFIKYLGNRKDGVKGYIVVDSGNGNAELVKLDKGMKYMPSGYFFENLYRKLRFKYPTFVFDDVNFEIDNNGNPYWIAPVVKYKGIGLLKDIKGAVILNVISGESKYYDVSSIPSWVDHIYSADLIIEQVDDWGTYKNGFWNSVLSQKNVVNTTDGYNYLTISDDVYLYTGITSVANDEANIGFILSNLRTKETVFYSVAGAEEYSAMGSSEGQVQQMKYKATFPLLINLNGRPTYLISLKDNAGLVKMYSFVDVADYQKVVVTDSSKGIEEAARQYLNVIGMSAEDSKTIKIKSIKDVMINGTTYYYIVSSEGDKYRVSIDKNEFVLPFLNIGDSVVVSYKNGEVKEIIKLEEELWVFWKKYLVYLRLF